MRFSVIMPVYNAGPFLRAAISSILDQVFRNFELLLIDDGATDGSAAICDEYATQDNRVHVFHKKNGGICNARNFGISKAKGQYIMFADHDDEFLPDYMSVVDDAIIDCAGAADIVKVNFSLADRYLDGQYVITHKGRIGSSCKWSLSSEYELFERLTLAVWDGAYNREFVLRNDLRFDESLKVGCEDFKFMLQCLSLTENVYWRHEVCYRHYNNFGISTSSKWHEKRIADIIDVALLEAKLFPATQLKRKLEQFRRWNGAIVISGLMIQGAPKSFFREVSFMYRMRRRLLPVPPTTYTREDGLTFAEKIFILFFRFHLFWLYCMLTLIKWRHQLTSNQKHPLYRRSL